MAGAEGLEPSARGFGVDVGRKQRKKKWRSRGVCQGEEGSCGAELVLKAGAGKNIARTLREEKSDIGKPIVRAWGKHRGPNRRRFCRQREKKPPCGPVCSFWGRVREQHQQDPQQPLLEPCEPAVDENGKIKKGRNERPSGLSPVGRDGKINLTRRNQ